MMDIWRLPDGWPTFVIRSVFHKHKYCISIFTVEAAMQSKSVEVYMRFV